MSAQEQVFDLAQSAKQRMLDFWNNHLTFREKIILAIMAVAVLYLATFRGGSGIGSDSGPVPPGATRLAKNVAVCPTRSDLFDIMSLSMQGDQAAAKNAFRALGCRVFPAGIVAWVYEAGGLTCVRPQGAIDCYWAEDREAAIRQK